MRNGIYIIFISIFAVVLLVGCAASSDDIEKVMNILEEKNYIESGLKYLDKSRVKTGSFDATPTYTSYDVYGKNGKYYSFDFDKIVFHSDDNKNCDYIVTIYDDVRFLRDQEVTKYNDEKKEYEVVIEDIYDTNTGSYKKYCINIKNEIVEEYN